MPITSAIDKNVEPVKKIDMKNRRITIREEAGNVGILVDFGHDTSVSEVCFDQNHCMSIAQELLNDSTTIEIYLKG